MFGISPFERFCMEEVPADGGAGGGGGNPAPAPAPAGDPPADPPPNDPPAGDPPAADPKARAPIGASDPEFILPDEYKDKPWAAKVKSQEDILKLIDNQDSLLGKKTIQPIDYKTATPEEIAAHHSSLAPESVEDYNFGENADPEFSKAVGEVFQEFGINPYQAEGLSAKINEIASQMVGAQQEADTSKDGYLAIMKESFGDDFEKIAGGVENQLKAHASDEDKQIFDSVDNKTRSAVDRTVHALTVAYEARIKAILDEHGVVETGAQTEGGEGQNQGVDVEKVRKDLRAELREIDKRPHSAQEKQILKDKLDATYR